MEAAVRVSEGLAAGGLAGLAAAVFYIGFFGRGRGAALAGAGSGLAFFGAFLQASAPMAVGAPAASAGALLSACWMMATGGIYRTRQWRELFLAGGTWLLVLCLACLWPDFAPLQILSALALLGMTALFLLGRGKLYPLWMGTLLCLWLLAGFLDGMAYGQRWREQIVKAAGYLVLGGIFVFQQIYCARQEMRRRAWEEPEERGACKEVSENWRKAADQEYVRLRIFEHDFRHHLDMLGALYEQGNPAEARAYLEDLKQARLSGRGRINGGERELSCIMMAKQEACRKARIQFSCQILGSPRGIAQMDMTALLLNLLDNAIRACEKAPEPRSIGIMLLARGSLWQIELVNTGLYDPGKAQRTDSCGAAQEKTGRQEPGAAHAEKTAHAEKPAHAEKTVHAEKPAHAELVPHGIGLISVRQIVEKYQGMFEIRQEGNRVIQKAILTGQFPE